MVLRSEVLEKSVCGELSVQFLVYFVLEESKPQAAVRLPEAAKKPEATDKTKKVETRSPSQEETRPGIQTVVLQGFKQHLECFHDAVDNFSCIFYA